MSNWSYVIIGWLTTYVVIAIWYVTSRPPHDRSDQSESGQ